MADKQSGPPSDGGRIEIKNGQLQVPDQPILPFIEGDGTGRDIWRASQRVFDATVEKTYGGKRRIAWYEVLAGEKAFNETGEWLPDKTVDAFREYLVGIKGPLTTPIGGGIRSLNVALRQELDLYVCLRPVRYFQGVPSPVKRPHDVDMVIFRENTEDIYAGIEYAAETPEAKKIISFLQNDMGVKNIRFPNTSGIGIKPVSREGSERLVRAAIRYGLDHGRRNVALVHKGNIMKFTEGAFRDWGYDLAARDFRQETVSERESWILGNREDDANISAGDNARAVEPGYDLMTESRQAEVKKEVESCLDSLWATHGDGKWKKKLLVRDAIADITLPADPHAREIVRYHRHHEPQWRLLVGCTGRTDRRDWNRARRQHQLRHRPRHLRGDPWDGPQVRRQGSGQSGIGHPLGGHDVPSSPMG